MGKKINLMGMRFERLVVIEEAERCGGGHARWICKCDCGKTTKPIIGTDLRTGKVRSCGCLHNEQLKVQRFKHGKKNARLYRIWLNMKSRCYIPTVPCFKFYGGRGISVCDEWLHDYVAFYDWAMANGYSADLSLDRIDVNKNYEPSNCRWLTQKEQSNNMRKNVFIKINGEVHTIAEWSEISGIKYTTLYNRMRYGWEGAKLLKPVENSKIGSAENGT